MTEMSTEAHPAEPVDREVDPDELSCAELLKALADETRLGVVKRLLHGRCRAGELQKVLEVEQSLLSHHLRQLREAGIVLSEREGKGVVYRLSRGVENRVRGREIDLGCCRLAFDS